MLSHGCRFHGSNERPIVLLLIVESRLFHYIAIALKTCRFMALNTLETYPKIVSKSKDEYKSISHIKACVLPFLTVCWSIILGLKLKDECKYVLQIKTQKMNQVQGRFWQHGGILIGSSY